MALKCLKTLMLKEKLTIFTMGSWVKLDLNTKKELQQFQQEKSSTNKSNKKRSKRKLVKKMSSKQDSTLLGWLEVLILHSIC